MRKKEGFTLIELLVVIAILAVILLMAVPIIVSNIGESKDNAYNNQITLFVNGAERYALEYNNDLLWEESDIEGVKKAIVTLRELADKDYVNLPVINPITGEAFDPDTTRVIIYKYEDGSLKFEYEDINGFRIVVGTKVQTILQSTEYTSNMIMTDIYGKDNNGNDITDSITYTCKYDQQDVDCNILKLKTKELGTYYITYRLELDGKVKTETRTIKVVNKSTPIIVVRPEDTGIKVDKVRVTIIYPDGSLSKTYSTKYVSNKNYQIGFDVTENQVITADCIDKNGLKCDTAQTIIKHIKSEPPKIESIIVPTSLIDGYAKSQTVKVTYKNQLLMANQLFIKTTRPGVSNLNVTLACGSGDLPGDCIGISETTSLSANTWYRVSSNVNITYNTTSNDIGTIYAVLYDTTFSDVVSAKLEKIDSTGPKLELNDEVLTTKTVLLAYSANDLETGLEGSTTCKYGTVNGTFDKTGTISYNYICRLDNLKAGTTYYYQICATDKLGNKTCRTGSTKTSTMVDPKITFTNTPTTAVNGYLKQQIAVVKFDNSNITVPEYFIKTTKSGKSSLAVSQVCGNERVPSNCSNIGSTTNLSANTWYKVSGNVNVTYDKTSNETGVIYAIVYDGFNYSGAATGTLSKIDNSGPTLTMNTATAKTNTIILSYTLDDGETNSIQSVTCKYGTSNGNYTLNGTNVSQTSCTLPSLKTNTTYYYEVCAIDKLGNKTCKQGSSKPVTITNPSIAYTNTPATAVNGYLKQQMVRITFNGTGITSPQYFVKTTKSGTSSLAVSQACGNGKVPSNCSNIGSTKNLSANTWYKVSGNVNITYDKTSNETGVIYAVTYDGVNYSDSATGTISKIDNNGPTVTLREALIKTNALVIPYTLSDSETNIISSVTCKYGTSNGNYTLNGTNVSQSSCTLPNLKTNTTYYYEVCAIDKLGNKTCKQGNSKIIEVPKPSISFTNNPTNPVNGYLKQQIARVTFNSTGITSPQYFVKTTRLGKSSLAVSQVCGTGTVPGGCTNIGSTKNLSANTWYKVSGNVNVAYDTTSSDAGTIYAVTYDGVNYSEAATGTISKIDNTTPTAKIVVVNGAGITINNNGNIGRANESTINFECNAGPSGVKTYTYSSSVTYQECTPITTVSNGTTIITGQNCKNVNKPIETNITTTPHKIKPSSLGVPSSVNVVTHTLTCTNNIGNTSAKVTFTTNLVNPPVINSFQVAHTTTSSILVSVRATGTGIKYRYSMTNNFSGAYKNLTSNVYSGLSMGSNYTLWVQVTDEVGQTATSSTRGTAEAECSGSCGYNGSGYLTSDGAGGCSCEGGNGPTGGSSGGSSSSGSGNQCTDAATCLHDVSISGGSSDKYQDITGDGIFDSRDVALCMQNKKC